MSEGAELERIRKLETQCALMSQTIDQQQKKLDNLSSGINRGLWIIGGGFIAAAVSWVVKGGMTGV